MEIELTGDKKALRRMGDAVRDVSPHGVVVCLVDCRHGDVVRQTVVHRLRQEPDVAEPEERAQLLVCVSWRRNDCITEKL